MLILIMHFIGRRLFLWWIIQQVDEKEVKIKGSRAKSKYGEFNLKKKKRQRRQIFLKSKRSRNFSAVKTRNAATRRGATKNKKREKIEK